jgi:predicted outer membrane protein
MDKKLLKGLLVMSAVAAMLGAFGVQAQTAGQPASTPAASQSGSMGKDHSGSKDWSGSKDQSGMKDQSTGSSSGSSGMSGSTGTSGSQAQGASGAAGATAAADAMDKGDQKMLMNMAQAAIDQVETAKIAQGKSESAEVKAYAQQMIDDNSKALTEIQALAQKKGVTLPTEPDTKHKTLMSKFEHMKGDAFDKAYMSQSGVIDHRVHHDALMKGEKKAKDADLKAMMAKLAPMVEQHLRSAQQMPAAKTGTTSGK